MFFNQRPETNVLLLWNEKLNHDNKQRPWVSEKFEDLEVWQSARNLVPMIYALCREEGFARDFGLRDQIQRAAVSIMSNIAEGFEHSTNKELIRFLFIAKASAGEVRSQLYVALDLGYIQKEAFEKLNADLLSISRQISGFIKYLRQAIKDWRL